MEVKSQYGLFIDGKWQNSSGGKTFEARNPANGALITVCTEATAEDVDAAVKAAWKAFNTARSN